jgi:hypothetical protein
MLALAGACVLHDCWFEASARIRISLLCISGAHYLTGSTITCVATLQANTTVDFAAQSRRLDSTGFVHSVRCSSFKQETCLPALQMVHCRWASNACCRTKPTCACAFADAAIII